MFFIDNIRWGPLKGMMCQKARFILSFFSNMLWKIQGMETSGIFLFF